MTDNANNLIERAEHLIEIERHSEAIPLISKALGLEPESAYANGLMAQAFLGLNRLDDALKYSEKTIELEPDDEWSHRLRSNVLTEMGHHGDALKSAEEAARLSPDEPAPLTTLANAWLSVKKPKKAKEVGEKLIETAPHWEGSHFTMGNIYLEAGDNFLAEKSFREALKINPNFANARNNLGVAIMRQDTNSAASMFGLKSNSIIASPGSAGDHFHEALKLEPGNEHAADNFKSQYSYVTAIVPIFAFIPFMMMTFIVLPIGTLISIGITIFWSLRAVNDVRRKRAELSPEMLQFVSKVSVLGDGGILDTIAKTLWNCFLKTWKPHALALASLLIFVASAARGMSGLRFLPTLMMIAAFWWLAFESRRPD